MTIPNSVTNIGEFAFYGCDGLTSVFLPKSFKGKDASVFSGCPEDMKITYRD